MRIAFLTGSLQPGWDGVGDYTTLLANECAARGAATSVIALADRHIDRASVPASQNGAPLRLSYDMPWRERLRLVKNRVRAFEPDWVSVQFVPYSFQRHGIALSLAKGLPRVIQPARLHIMLHEIWTGGNGSWRQALVCAGQRWSVVELCRRASLVHTSTATYERLVESEGIAASRLPLFGSVSIAETSAMPWLAPALAETGVDGLLEHRDQWWLCVFFGTLHPVWPPEPLIARLHDAAAAAGRRVAFISVGRIGAGERLWEQMQTRYADAIPMLRLGEESQTRISELLRTVDFGIATSPLSLIGKSATAAAMLEHGLPVIVNREDGPAASDDAVEPRDVELLIRLDERFASRLLDARRRPPERRLSQVAERLLLDLSQAQMAS